MLSSLARYKTSLRAHSFVVLLSRCSGETSGSPPTVYHYMHSDWSFYCIRGYQYYKWSTVGVFHRGPAGLCYAPGLIYTLYINISVLAPHTKDQRICKSKENKECKRQCAENMDIIHIFLFLRLIISYYFLLLENGAQPALNYIRGRF